jgi:selenocysteine lyase/cysteine desulfurase
LDDFASKLSSKTKVVAVNWAANAVGTITDVKKCIDLAREKGAITVIDAVHYAPHRWMDVKAIGADVVLCSAYKFFGPHLGVIYVKKEIGEKLKTVKVMLEDTNVMPWKLETGTPAMELAYGAAEAVEFIAEIGRQHEKYFSQALGNLSGRRRFIVAGMLAIDEYEEPLAKKLRTGLSEIKGVKVYGPPEGHPRTSTVSFTVDGVNSKEVGKYLGDRGLYVWNGHFYAYQIVTNVLGLEKQGGLVRIGLAPYNLETELDRLLDTVKEFVAKK